ncbi:hypothetical protein P4O66_005959, partial [Electrophorus voltai]
TYSQKKAVLEKDYAQGHMPCTLPEHNGSAFPIRRPGGAARQLGMHIHQRAQCFRVRMRLPPDAAPALGLAVLNGSGGEEHLSSHLSLLLLLAGPHNAGLWSLSLAWNLVPLQGLEVDEGSSFSAPGGLQAEPQAELTPTVAADIDRETGRGETGSGGDAAGLRTTVSTRSTDKSALQKLASQYLKREWPGIQSEEQKEYRNVCTVWRAYLEGVVKVTQSRISGSDSYKSQVSEPIKTFRTHKEQQLKKCIEQLTRIQAELQDTVKDLTKSRKQYQETEQMAQAVREKADMEAKYVCHTHSFYPDMSSALLPSKGSHNKIKRFAMVCPSTVCLQFNALCVTSKTPFVPRSKLSLFQSRSSLKRASVKVSAGMTIKPTRTFTLQLSTNGDMTVCDPFQLKAKRNECNSKATHARNEYLLTLAAANAHQGRYYDNDLLCCIKVLDGSVYDHMKGYLVSLCQAELEAAHTVQDTFNFLLEKSTGVMQDFHQELFIQENPVFQQAQLFQFQPCDNDPVSPSPSTPSKDGSHLTEGVSQLQKETGTAEEHSLNKEARRWATRVAREHKNIMHHQRTLSECEGSLQQEQNSGELDLKVEESRESIRKAETVKLKAEARLNLLRNVGVAVDTWLKSAMNQVMEELENERWATLTPHDASLCSTADLDREDDEETEDAETQDDSSSSPCSTLRNYPLTCKVLYSYQASQPDELSIEEQEVLEVIDDGDMEDWVKARNGAGQVGYVPEKYLQLPSSNSLLSMLQSLAALDARSRSSSNSAEQEPEPASEHARTRPSGDDGVSFAKALYDYEAQTEDELSFPEGAIIRILNKDNQEDDGFWEGELNGSMGVFPAVLVEDLAAANGDETPPHRGTETQGCSPRPLSMTQLQASACSSPASSAALPPLPTPTLPSGPAGASASPLPSPHSLNGFHRPAPGPPKTGHGHSLNSTPPPRYPADGGPGTLRPVRAAPPPPKQQAQGQVQKREEVEITLV